MTAAVPGSVQGALRAAGVLPDWNVGLDARACDWVENRHWAFETALPAEWFTDGGQVRLECQGLDDRGWVLWNARDIGTFCGAFVPHIFPVGTTSSEGRHHLQIVFDCPPRWLGQFGYTSRMTEWRARFNYTWDWTCRLVQIGVWDTLTLVVSDGEELAELAVTTDAAVETATGILMAQGTIAGTRGTHLCLRLCDGEAVIRQEMVTREAFAAGCRWEGLPIALWWPNGAGAQPLYDLHVDLCDADGTVLDTETRRVGFKHLAWEPCAGAPAGADPWLCVVNGQPLFLQGVNWTPVRPNYADVTVDEVTARLDTYAALGCNMLRVWGGAVLEREAFYAGCDARGLLVWQEFPLSSSGMENWPPEDEASIAAQSEIAVSYIRRRQHHVALALWCGGNELQGNLAGEKVGTGKPVDLSHPLMARFQALVAAHDPTRRFLPSSSSGPRFCAEEREFGQGVHWDVHGPWAVQGTMDDWQRYWEHDDALFRSETGCPGASPAALTRQYGGPLAPMPASHDNPLWRRTYWWIEWEACCAELGREPATLDAYVAWSQQRQTTALRIAVSATKRRFPAVGGILLWMGHDSFPCTANTAILDFHGHPKPAAEAVGEVFRTPIVVRASRP